MRLGACFATLLFLSACTTIPPSPREPAARDPRLANLQRAAKLPWTDEGRCAVREPSEPWPVLAERCFYSLDHDRVRFRDITGRCAVASAGAAVGVGLCVLAAPEFIVGAVIVVGVVVVGVAIKEALDAYALDMGHPEVRPVPDTRPVSESAPAPREPAPGDRPQQEPKGPDFPPVGPIDVSERERRRRCEPILEPHAGEDDAHNRCADGFPPNRYPGMDVLVDGVSFDALQVGARVLWEIKTHRFDAYHDFVQDMEVRRELIQINKQRKAAAACGYGYVVGVSTEAHKAALLDEDLTLNVVVTGCIR